MEQLGEIINLVSGSVSSIVLPILGYFFVYESKKRKEYAEGWRALYEQRDKRVGELNAKIDQLYAEKNDDRQHIGNLEKENTALTLENQTLRFKECQVRGCEKREPPTGY